MGKKDNDDIVGWGESLPVEDGYNSEAELDTHKLIAKKNKTGKGGGFQSLGLSKPVYRGVVNRGYKIPTPIQRKTLPLVLDGRDVVAMARTGSGKTACFLIPMFEKLLQTNHLVHSGPRALVLSPTRELAMQTLKFTRELGKFCGLKAAVILGGFSMEGQFEAIHSKPDILIATPGRLVHVCVEMNMKLDSIQYVVFDEADRIYEMGFSEQLNEILARLSSTRQTLLFSATLPKMLVTFAKAGLTNPVLIRLDVEHILPETLKLAFFKCNSEDKLPLLFYVLQNVIPNNQQSIIFVATSHHVEFLQTVLNKAGFSITFCYSNLDPAARKINIAKFQKRQVQHFIVTDVAARGIDIPLLDNVINFNFPAKPKMFVHRVGRAARAGHSGVAYNFISPDDTAHMKDLHLFLSKDVRYAPHPPVREVDDWNFMYGTVPQTVLDNENEEIHQIHEALPTELERLKRYMDNGYAKYLRCRPIASKDSVNRMKEDELLTAIGHHPLLLQDTEEAELDSKRVELLHKLKHLSPKITVFEMSRTKKEFQSKLVSNMKDKRRYDEQRIRAFKKTMVDKKDSKAEQEKTKKESYEKVKQLEQSTNAEVESAFMDIVSTQKKRRLKNDAVTEKETKSFIDQEFYIPYTRDQMKNGDNSNAGRSFHKDALEAALDMTQDDEIGQDNARGILRWNRKKKKFVGTQKDKKIKTESGAYINASYKTDRYKKWLEKGKKEENEFKDEDDDRQSFKKRKGIKTLNKVSGSKVHPLMKGKLPSRKKIELRTDAAAEKAKKIRDKRFKREQECIAKKKEERNKKLKSQVRKKKLDAIALDRLH